MRSKSARTRVLLAVAFAAVGAAAMPAASSGISGTHPWIVVLCKFTDLSSEPNPPSYYQGEYAGSTSSTLDFLDWWRDVSYGNLSVSGTAVVSHWYSLGMTRYEWAGLNRYDKIRTCAETAVADVNYNNYYGVIALFNDDRAARTQTTTVPGALTAGTTSIAVANSAAFPAPPFAAWIDDGTDTNGDGNSDNGEEVHVTAVSGNTWTVTRGYESGQPAKAHNAGATATLIDGGDLGESGPNAPVGVTLGGNPYTLGFVVGPPNFNLTGSAHETGHSFGYNHSRKLSTSTTDYADCYDDMSAYQVCDFVGDWGGPNLGSPDKAAGPGLTAIMLDLQGWLPGARVYTLDNTACNQTTLTLAALNHAEAAGYLAGKIPATLTIPTPGSTTTTSQHYWFEYRERNGWDAGLPSDAVILHLRGADSYAYWVDNAGGNGALEVGESFVNAGQNTYIAVNSVDTTAHQARVTIAGCKLNAAAAYNGDTSGDFNDVVQLAGDLTASGSTAPIPNAPVTLALGTQSCTATTNAAGHAACSLRINQHPGAYTASIAYAGNAAYNATTGTAPFTVTKEESLVTYTGARSEDYHDAFTASARLTDPVDGVPIAGKTIVFTLGAGDTCSAVTDGAGNASCSIVPTQPAGIMSLVSLFAGDVDYLASTDSDAFEILHEETTTTYTGPTVILAGSGSSVTLSARLLEDGNPATPIAGRTLVLSLGAQSCTAVTNASGVGACTLTFTGALGPQPLAAHFAGDAYYLPSADTGRTAIVFSFPSRGAFVLGDRSVALATPSTSMSWWGAQWSSLNELSGGAAPSAFKGFAGTVALPTSTPPAACGGPWTTRPGNSTPPVGAVPSYMGVLVASSVSKAGSTISGDVVSIVVVHTDGGYAPHPGAPGTGTIVATYC